MAHEELSPLFQLFLRLVHVACTLIRFCFIIPLYVGRIASSVWLAKTNLFNIPAQKKTAGPDGTPQRTKVAVVGGGIAGTSAAWSLHLAGYEVEIFESRDVLGGNAKTNTWTTETGKKITTGLSVLAWPTKYFRNYIELLNRLKLETTSVRLPFWIHNINEDAIFAQGKKTLLSHEHATDNKQWNNLIEFIRTVNRALAAETDQTIYSMPVLSPFNLITLRTMCFVFGISTEYWNKVLVPIYSSSFLTAKLDTLPASIGPAIDDMISPNRVPVMDSWTNTSHDVFDRMTADIKVHTSTPVTKVQRHSNGTVFVATENGDVTQFDRVVLACSADIALSMLSEPSWLERTLLSCVGYTDDDDNTFVEGVIHSDDTVIPARDREEVLSTHSNYVAVYDDHMSDIKYENTFIFSSWIPLVQKYKASHKGEKVVMLATYNSQRGDTIKNVRGTVTNYRAHPHMHLKNLVLSVLIRFIQGAGGVFYCSSYTTPGNGHDLSLLSGFIVANAIGAPYPFAKHSDGSMIRDFDRLRALMGL
eukprot:GFYU01004360.1.p1 GENE.GFYU01004360.1~~GFYU01004360.1.p1  ORF type:complete len:532 (-),score=136.44 GFYU01004360.1:38-1633(-)